MRLSSSRDLQCVHALFILAFNPFFYLVKSWKSCESSFFTNCALDEKLQYHISEFQGFLVTVIVE